jgi:AcrR family transcriptional regulator
MSSPQRHRPRKNPRQKRSQELVDAMLDAATRVLSERGLDAATTNEIARVAGVSVGSLYQYFPGKEAMLAAALERNYLRGMERVFALPARSAASFGELLREGLEAVVELYRKDLKFYRAVLLHIPRVGRVEEMRAHVRVGREQLRAAIVARRDEFRAIDPDLASFVIISSLEWVILACILDEPDRLSDPHLVDEMIALVDGYLAPRATA